MQTDRIKVTGSGGGFEQALEETAKLAGYVGLNSREALRLRLLTEETLGLISAIVENFDAEFWIEADSDKICRIHLTAKADMNYSRKKELISTSTSGKNAARTGFMGKIRDLFENGLYSMDEMGALQAEYGCGPVMYGHMGMYYSTDAVLWSMERYRKSVEESKSTDQAAEEAWDELEKSIVANIADDVSVAVKGSNVELIIKKRFAADSGKVEVR